MIAGQAVAAEDFCRDKKAIEGCEHSTQILQRCEQLQSYTSYLEYGHSGTGGGYDD